MISIYGILEMKLTQDVVVERGGKNGASFNLNDTVCNEILSKRDRMMESFQYNEFFIVLYEEPEGSPRPRFRLVNRKNLANSAIANSQFVHVYSITGAEDNKFMNRLVTEQDLM